MQISIFGVQHQDVLEKEKKTFVVECGPLKKSSLCEKPQALKKKTFIFAKHIGISLIFHYRDLVPPLSTGKEKVGAVPYRDIVTLASMQYITKLAML
jgi:hypothetical protein